MKEIIIEPHIGIGQLKLGMTSDELENALLQMKKQCRILLMKQCKWNVVRKPMTLI